ncbi:MAG: rhodanese-like domain-containing protein [Phycisphaeraceae bacterium]
MNAKPAANLDADGLPPGYPLDRDWEVTPRDVQAMRQRGDRFVLLDCRRPEEHAYARLDGATLVPLQELPQRVAELEAHKDERVVVYCHHGRRSLHATALLRQAGFSNVQSMAGGIDLWSRGIDPDVPRY